MNEDNGPQVSPNNNQFSKQLLQKDHDEDVQWIGMKYYTVIQYSTNCDQKTVTKNGAHVDLKIFLMQKVFIKRAINTE